MSGFADDRSRAVFRGVADAVEAATGDKGGIFDLEDGRLMTVIVLHNDEQENNR